MKALSIIVFIILLILAFGSLMGILCANSMKEPVSRKPDADSGEDKE